MDGLPRVVQAESGNRTMSREAVSRLWVAVRCPWHLPYSKLSLTQMGIFYLKPEQEASGLPCRDGQRGMVEVLFTNRYLGALKTGESRAVYYQLKAATSERFLGSGHSPPQKLCRFGDWPEPNQPEGLQQPEAG